MQWGRRPWKGGQLEQTLMSTCGTSIHLTVTKLHKQASTKLIFNSSLIIDNDHMHACIHRYVVRVHGKKGREGG
jgi:hypothetical protein